MIVYDVDNVTKVYPRQSIPANKGISLQIHRGEIFGPPGRQRRRQDHVGEPDGLTASAVRQTLVGPVTIRLALDVSVMLAIMTASLWWVGQKMTWRAE